MGPSFAASGVVGGFPPSCKAGAANRIACARFDIIYGMTLAGEHQRVLVQILRPVLDFAAIARRPATGDDVLVDA